MLVYSLFRYVLSSILFLSFGKADQIVYLDRFGLRMADSGDIMVEPLFNPKSINASVGENVTFVTRLEDISGLSVFPLTTTLTV
jgi:hypothetical protein